MKTLKILTVAFIASLFMLACEDAPEPSKPFPAEVTEAPEWHSSQAAYN